MIPTLRDEVYASAIFGSRTSTVVLLLKIVCELFTDIARYSGRQDALRVPLMRPPLRAGVLNPALGIRVGIYPGYLFDPAVDREVSDGCAPAMRHLNHFLGMLLAVGGACPHRRKTWTLQWQELTAGSRCEHSLRNVFYGM